MGILGGSPENRNPLRYQHCYTTTGASLGSARGRLPNAVPPHAGSQGLPTLDLSPISLMFLNQDDLKLLFQCPRKGFLAARDINGEDLNLIKAGEFVRSP